MKPTLLTSMMLSAVRWLERVSWWASTWRSDRRPEDRLQYCTVARWCRASWTLWRLTAQRLIQEGGAA